MGMAKLAGALLRTVSTCRFCFPESFLRVGRPLPQCYSMRLVMRAFGSRQRK